MSFGFAIGDFFTVGELAWRLYRDCYKIARGAPQEFQLLVGEISTLSNSLTILQEEAKDPDSALVRAGEDRIRMVNEMVNGIAQTLHTLERVAKKYEILGSNSKRKVIWAKFKWSVNFTSIDGLRNKLVYHNTVMNLLLTSVGNSSLQRIESSTDALENDVREIKSYITGSHSSGALVIPSISAFDDDTETSTLSASLMQHAEVLQPWSTIGVVQWIESGRWWLLHAQLELHAIVGLEQKVPLAPYTSLIKASWILIDIISCHPQVPFLTASTHSELHILSAELKSEFQRLKDLAALTPSLSDLESQDLRIWEAQSKGPLLRPQKETIGSQPSVTGDQWRVEGGEEVLFQRFALLKLQALPDPLPCIILFLVDKNLGEVRIWAQTQSGSGVVAMSFETEVNLAELGACDLILNNEQITFSSPQDAQMLCSLVEGANFCCHGTLYLDCEVDNIRALTIINAIKAQRRETAARLLEKSPFVNRRESTTSDELLAIVSYLAHEQAEGTLNEALCDENETPRSKLPLLQWAIECGHVDLANFIISKQPVETEGDSWRQMHPLGLACHCGHEAIVKALIHDANTKNPNGQWPLHLAASRGHTKIVRLLLRNGADVDPQGHYGMTPLGVSARNGHESTVELLIDRGANLHHQSHERKSALHEACDTKREGVIAILLEEGSKCDLEKNDGETPYALALRRRVSRPTFDLLASKYYAQTKQAPCIPQTRGTITWTIDTDWAALWLNSPGAYFENLNSLPSNVEATHQRMIDVRRPAGVTTHFWKWTFECDIVYSTEWIHLSTGHGSTGTDNKGSSTVLTVRRYKGDTDTEQRTFTTGPTGHALNFRQLPAVHMFRTLEETA